MKMQGLFLVASCVYLAALAVVTYLTRATRRRLLGALAGGLAVAVAGVGVEVLCQTLGFWHYPAAKQRYGPVLIYPVLILMFAVYALIGWRMMRRFGWRGQAVFLTAVTVVGTIRDYWESAHGLGLIVFAPGLTTVLVDATCWLVLTALAQAVMRLVAGSAAADPLARR